MNIFLVSGIMVLFLYINGFLIYYGIDNYRYRDGCGDIKISIMFFTGALMFNLFAIGVWVG